MVSNQGLAQFSISKVPSEADTRLKKDSVKPISAVSNEFFSEARFRAEKRRLRKERNTLTCTVGLNLNQTKFDNWAPGGVNTFPGWPRCFLIMFISATGCAWRPSWIRNTG